MALPKDTEDLLRQLADGAAGPALDFFGPILQFVTPEENDQICVMRGFLPPKATVPLHNHDDFEDFYVLTGSHQVLVEGKGGLEWRDAVARDYIRVPGGVPHAHRNVSGKLAVDLIITTPSMGRFFREAGRPLGSPPPTAREVMLFAEIASRYGYRLATAEENAAVGITLPTFTS